MLMPVMFMASPVALMSNVIIVRFVVPVWLTFDARSMPVTVRFPNTLTEGLVENMVKFPPFEPRALTSKVLTRASFGADQFSTLSVAESPAARTAPPPFVHVTISFVVSTDGVQMPAAPGFGQTTSQEAGSAKLTLYVIFILSIVSVPLFATVKV